MLTITLNQNTFSHKDAVVAFLEDEIRELATSIDYEVVEGDFNCVGGCDEIFNNKVNAVLARATDNLGC